MKSLLIFMLEAWYTDVRKSVPATVSNRVNSGIRAFSNADPTLREIVNLAKKSGAAAVVHRKRSQIKFNLARQRRYGANIKHVPCRKVKG